MIMKTYIKPETSLYQLKSVTLLGESQAGVQNGDSVQDEYNSSDVSYGRSVGLWDDGE